MTRALAPIPGALVDPATGQPAWGSYEGAFESTELASLCRNPIERLTTEKRWFYGAIAVPNERLMLGFAIVDLGYAANAFAFAWDEARGLVVDRSMLGVPGFASVRSRRGHRIDARFARPGASLKVSAREGDPEIAIDVKLDGLELRAHLDERGAPPSLTAVAPIANGRVNCTEKRAPMNVRGSAVIAGRRVSLDGALGGYDLTHGLLARTTRWNWAFAMGETASGERFALNLVQGFVGEPECALWIGDEVLPLAEGRFEYDAHAPERPWRVRTADGTVDLTFTPGAVHREHRDLGLVSSRFLQPIGTFDGTIQARGRTLHLSRVLGVVEDQDVKW